ncbi:unnamed protein product [Cylicostephanus goldi]|uniref:Uncharacterized protein n=1 Tax=Cylicostephanus goldi TaxID=71465 RepID=A0A3P6QR79_CYLGO|nr:unnamed protein product [Cylicostephanus goldi]
MYGYMRNLLLLDDLNEDTKDNRLFRGSPPRKGKLNQNGFRRKGTSWVRVTWFVFKRGPIFPPGSNPIRLADGTSCSGPECFAVLRLPDYDDDEKVS